MLRFTEVSFQYRSPEVNLGIAVYSSPFKHNPLPKVIEDPRLSARLYLWELFIPNGSHDC